MKEIIYNGDKAYQLVRVLKEDQLKDPDTSLLKKWFVCDTLLRNQGKLYFCRLIEDIEYEEINIWYVLRWWDQCRDSRETARKIREE